MLIYEYLCHDTPGWVSTHTHTYTHARTHTHTQIHPHTHAYNYTRTHTHAHRHTQTQTKTQTQTQTLIQTDTDASTHAPTHTHTRKFTYTHITHILDPHTHFMASYNSLSKIFLFPSVNFLAKESYLLGLICRQQTCALNSLLYTCTL